MDISQIQTQQITTQANQAAAREREIATENAVSDRLTETQQYEVQQKYDTLEISNEGRAAIDNAQMSNADTKSVAMTGVQTAATAAEAATSAPTQQAPVAEPVEAPTVQTDTSVDDLSTYTKQELRQMVNNGTITPAQYDAEIESRESEEEAEETDNSQSSEETTQNSEDDKDKNSIGFGQDKN